MGASSDDYKVEETEAETAAAKVAKAKWDLYQNQFVPHENKMIQRATGIDPTTGKKVGGGYNSDSYHRQAEGAANVATQSAAANAVKNGISQMTASGFNPGSGKFQAVVAQGARSEAKSNAGSQNRSSQSVQDRYMAGQQAISAMGQGQATQAQSGMMDIAAGANQKAIDDAAMEWQNNAGVGQAIGSGAGMYAGHKWG